MDWCNTLPLPPPPSPSRYCSDDLFDLNAPYYMPIFRSIPTYPFYEVTEQSSVFPPLPPPPSSSPLPLSPPPPYEDSKEEIRKQKNRERSKRYREKKKIIEQEKNKLLQEVFNAKNTDTPINNYYYPSTRPREVPYCSLCAIFFRSMSQFKDHTTCKKHKEAIKRSQEKINPVDKSFFDDE